MQKSPRIDSKKSGNDSSLCRFFLRIFIVNRQIGKGQWIKRNGRQDTQFVIRTLSGELCKAFADGKEGQKTAVGFLFFAVRPPDDFPLLKIRSCFTFNHRGNSSQNYSLIGNLRKISAKDFFLLPRCYLPPFSIISRNIKNVFFPFCFKRLKNTTRASHSLSDGKAILQRNAPLKYQRLPRRPSA